MAFAWGGYVAQAASGFVMPRLISDSLGQTTLGIWDFAWSLVTYLGFLQLGLSGSVNRFVAHYRAKGDVVALNRSVSTVALSLKITGAIAVVATIIGAGWLLPLFATQLGSHLRVAQFVSLLLGLEVAVSLMFAANLGVLVGCLRSDLHYTVSTVVYTVTALGMAAALLAGGGLPAIAFIHFAVTTGGELVRWRLASRVCPELVVDYSTASWSVWRDQAKFTAKSVLPTIADSLVNQTVSMLLALYLGPAILAIYSRPRNLVRQVRTIIARFGYLLVPTASSLQARSETDELRKTLCEKSSQIAFVAIPIAVTMAVLGDDVIRMWMGERYVYHHLVAVLALGALPSWLQEPGWGVLCGMNRHGPLAIAKFGAALCAIATLMIGLSVFQWGLLSLALGLVVPIALVDACAVPLFVCRVFKLRLSHYYKNTYLKPMLSVAPYAGGLLLVRNVLDGGLLALAAVFLAATPVTILTYRRTVLDLDVGGWNLKNGSVGSFRVATSAEIADTANHTLVGSQPGATR